MALALSVLIKTTFLFVWSPVRILAFSSIYIIQFIGKSFYSTSVRTSFFQDQKSTLSIKPGSKMFAHHHRRAGDKMRICVESMVGVFDLFSLKIVSPLWRNDLVYLSPQVKLFHHWRCGEWLALYPSLGILLQARQMLYGHTLQLQCIL